MSANPARMEPMKRFLAYTNQTGSLDLTPKQQQRFNKKVRATARAATK
jgi:hypothetical protein